MNRATATMRSTVTAAALTVTALLTPTTALPPSAPAVVGVPLASADSSAAVLTPSAATGVVDTGGLVESTVGQLLSDDVGCTATVVNSPTGRIAVTAAHCVYVPERRDNLGDFYAGLRPGWLSGLVFLPGRKADQAPHGIWTVTRAWIDQRWRDHADLAYDVAFIELAELDGLTAQEALGAQGISFTGDAAGDTTVFGYPAAPPFNGTSVRSCAGRARPLEVGIVALACDMTAGSSGGPWLTGIDNDGAGTVAAVTSFAPLDESGRVAGVALGPAAYEVWHAATSTSGELPGAPADHAVDQPVNGLKIGNVAR